MSIYSPLSNRTISAFPLSIGTSLALESIFEGKLPAYDPDRQIPVKIPVDQYQEIWINLSTLIRNILGAVSKEDYLKVKPRDILDALTTEIGVINSLFKEEGNNICTPIYYQCDYKSLLDMIKHSGTDIRLRNDKTSAQKHHTGLIHATLDSLFDTAYGDDIIHYTDSLKPKKRVNALIITHIPFDLISYSNYKRLDLLESHTGRLKPRSLWYTKYYPVANEDMSHLPFTLKLLLIFGDHVMFHPANMSIRREIIQIARQKKLTSMSSEKLVDMVMTSSSVNRPDIRSLYASISKVLI